MIGFIKLLVRELKTAYYRYKAETLEHLYHFDSTLSIITLADDEEPDSEDDRVKP